MFNPIRMFFPNFVSSNLGIPLYHHSHSRYQNQPLPEKMGFSISKIGIHKWSASPGKAPLLRPNKKVSGDV